VADLLQLLEAAMRYSMQAASKQQQPPCTHSAAGGMGDSAQGASAAAAAAAQSAAAKAPASADCRVLQSALDPRGHGCAICCHLCRTSPECCAQLSLTGRSASGCMMIESTRAKNLNNHISTCCSCPAAGRSCRQQPSCV
jgi:hypothetical protein